jgi:hypothetical protein
MYKMGGIMMCYKDEEYVEKLFLFNLVSKVLVLLYIKNEAKPIIIVGYNHCRCDTSLSNPPWPLLTQQLLTTENVVLKNNQISNFCFKSCFSFQYSIE